MLLTQKGKLRHMSQLDFRVLLCVGVGLGNHLKKMKASQRKKSSIFASQSVKALFSFFLSALQGEQLMDDREGEMLRSGNRWTNK